MLSIQCFLLYFFPHSSQISSHFDASGHLSIVCPQDCRNPFLVERSTLKGTEKKLGLICLFFLWHFHKKFLAENLSKIGCISCDIWHHLGPWTNPLIRAKKSHYIGGRFSRKVRRTAKDNKKGQKLNRTWAQICYEKSWKLTRN